MAKVIDFQAFSKHYSVKHELKRRDKSRAQLLRLHFDRVSTVFRREN